MTLHAKYLYKFNLSINLSNTAFISAICWLLNSSIVSKKSFWYSVLMYGSGKFLRNRKLNRAFNGDEVDHVPIVYHIIIIMFSIYPSKQIKCKTKNTTLSEQFQDKTSNRIGGPGGSTS